MREYLWGLTLTCVAAVVLRCAAGKDRGGKYVDMICSLCVVCALVLPVVPVIPQISEYGIESFLDDGSLDAMSWDGGAIYNGYVYGVSVEQAEMSLEGELCDKLGVGADDIDVRLMWEEESDVFFLTEAVVYIHSGAMDKDPYIISSYIEERAGVCCRIIY